MTSVGGKSGGLRKDGYVQLVGGGHSHLVMDCVVQPSKQIVFVGNIRPISLKFCENPGHNSFE